MEGYDPSPNGGNDLFVARLHLSSSDPAKLTYSTYLGGADDDYGFGVATDTGGNAFVTGIRGLGAAPELSDAMVSKLKMSSPPAAPAVSIAASGANALLTWGAVPSTANYQVFRSGTPYFLPGSWSSQLPLSEPTVPSYSDTGALTPVNAYTRSSPAARDCRGERGRLRRQAKGEQPTDPRTGAVHRIGGRRRECEPELDLERRRHGCPVPALPQQRTVLQARRLEQPGLPIFDQLGTSYPDDNVLTQVGAYFYVVKPVNSDPAAGPNSNEVGKFTFQLAAGTN